MVDHAIVIGIDAYQNEDWVLKCAVRDAIAFARWVTEDGAGRASTETLTLLLSPRAGHEPDDLDWEPATRQAIHDALYSYARESAGNGAERFWLFYAGHGVMAADDGANEPPVLVPEEVSDIDRYLFDAPLALKKYVGPLQLTEPKTQLFFIDACREVATPDDNFTLSMQPRFDLNNLGGSGDKIANQAMLYAATAGQLANEAGLHGLFGRALIEVLNGRAQLRIDNATGRRSLTFSDLRKFTISRVRELSAKNPSKKLATQDPWSSYQGTSGELVVAEFAPDQVPRAKLSLFVEPAAAQQVSRAGIVVWDEIEDQAILKKALGPPLPEPATWDKLALKEYAFQVEAEGFRTEEFSLKLFENHARPVELKPLDDSDRGMMEVISLPGGEILGGFLRSAVGTLRNSGLLWDDGSVLPDSGSESRTSGAASARLQVSATDRFVRIEIFSELGKRVAAGFGQVIVRDLRPGPYRVEFETPGAIIRETSVALARGESKELHAPGGIQMPANLKSILAELGFAPDAGYSNPSESFGPAVITTRIGSLLAWAAFAARFPESSDSERLRRVSIDPLTEDPESDCKLQILVADVGEGVHLPALNEEYKLAVGLAHEESPAKLKPVGGLPGLAGQWSAPLKAALTNVQFSAPGLAPKALTVPAIPGYVATIILAREMDGSIDVHRYLNPLHPAQKGHTEFSDVIRRAELNWRALKAGTPLLPGEAEEIILDKRFDPLFLAVLGYRLEQEGRLDLFGKPQADTQDSAESVISRLLEEAPQLPDVHVLAALAVRDVPTSYDAHMLAAANTGIPLVSDGAAILSGWLVAMAMREGAPPPTPTRSFISGGIWTALDARDDAAPVNTHAIPVETLERGDGPTWSDRIRPVATATAQIRDVPDRDMGTGTGFLVAPGLLLSAEVCLSAANPMWSPEEPLLPDGWSAVFDRASGRAIGLSRVQARSSQQPAFMDERMVLINLEGGKKLPIAKLDWTAPRLGQRIAVIGHPVKGFGIQPGAILDAFTSMPAGQKAVMPGIVVKVEESVFTYECWTLAGTAGGPVVDLESGHVLGVHLAGSYDDAAVMKYGIGVPLSHLQEDPMWRDTGVSPAFA